MPFLSTYIFMLLCYFVTFSMLHQSFPVPLACLVYAPVLTPSTQQHLHRGTQHALTFPCSQLDQVAVLNSSGSSASSEPAAKDLYMNFAKSMRGGKSEHDL